MNQENLSVGKFIEITDATNKSLIGIKGWVCDKTKKTITIMHDDGNDANYEKFLQSLSKKTIKRSQILKHDIKGIKNDR